MSCTATCCVALEVFPLASVAVHVTTVVPTGKVRGASLVTTGLGSTRSVTAAVPSATAVCCPVASTVTSGGGVSAGGVVSCTVTGNSPLLLLPALSVAVQVTVVVPIENVDPEGGSQPGVMESSPPTSSADATKSTTAPAPDVASSITKFGSARTGGALSALRSNTYAAPKKVPAPPCAPTRAVSPPTATLAPKKSDAAASLAVSFLTSPHVFGPP